MARRSIIKRIITTDLRKPDLVYEVELYEDGNLVERRQLEGKSLAYAEDVSENWDNGLIKTNSENE